MSWRFPEWLPTDKAVASPSDLERALRPLQDGLSALNEHNLDTSLSDDLDRVDNIDPSTAFRAAFSYVDGAAVESMTNSQATLATALSNISGWYEVQSTATTFTTEGGYFLVLAGGSMFTDTDTTDSTAARYCVMLDGNVLPSTIVGDIDDSDEQAHMERGLGGYRHGVQLVSVVYVGAGRRRLSLGVDVRPYQGITIDKPLLCLYGLPFFVLELRR